MSRASRPAAGVRPEVAARDFVEGGGGQPRLFESRRASGGSRSAPSQSSTKPSLSSADYSSPSFAACHPLPADVPPDPAHQHNPSASASPQSPIRRVVRAANKSRRRLKVTSADAFTLEAIQRRLGIFRDGGTSPPPNFVPADGGGDTANLAGGVCGDSNGTGVLKGGNVPATQFRSISSTLSPSLNNVHTFSQFMFSQNQQHRPLHPRNSPNSQTQYAPRHHRKKSGSRRKHDLPPRPVSGPATAQANERETEGENPFPSRPSASTSGTSNARPKSMSGMSDEKGQCCLTQQEHDEHDCDVHNDTRSQSSTKTNNKVDNDVSNSNTTIDNVSMQQSEQPYLPRLNSKRRYETRQMLLSFPEHDAATVHKLIAHYNGDHQRVRAKLAQERAQHQHRQQEQKQGQQTQQQQKPAETKGGQQRRQGDADHVDGPMKKQPPPLSVLNRDSRPQKEVQSRSTFSDQGNVDPSTSELKSRNRIPSPDTAKQTQITGTKRRRGDSRDTSSSVFNGSDTRTLGLSQIQSPITNLFSGQESSQGHHHGKSKSRLHLRSRLRARARKWHGHCETDGDVDVDDQSSTCVTASVACLPGSENNDEFENSSIDDCNKGECSHESDTSTSSNSDTTTATTCSVVDRSRLDDGKSQADAWERVRALEKTVSKLEVHLTELEEGNRRMRHQISCRLDVAMRDLSTIDKRHEGLSVEVEDNLMRVGKTEQYLDAMRRDLLLIVGQRQWAVLRIVRAGVHNILYYFLAYLVPILAFVVRLIRDVVLGVRRRLISST